MLKKILLTACTLLVFTEYVQGMPIYKDNTTFKDNPPPCVSCQYMAGPYLGLSIGSRTNYSSDPSIYKGVEGTLSLGYAYRVSPLFYVSLEAFGANNFVLNNYRPDAGASLRST